MPDETAIIEPKTDEIRIKGNLLGKFDDIAQRLASLQLFSIKVEADSATLLRVESRDMQKRPFLFIIIKFGKDSINIEYTIALDSSPKMRRLYVLKTLLGVLSLISGVYHADEVELFQNADSSIDDVMNSLSQSYSALFNNYDSLFNEYRELKRLNIELAASNKNLTVQASQISEENKELSERLKKLETYSDESLMVMVQEWIESHDSTIDVNDFANTHKLVPTRVEQILNKMVSLGYIELKG
ncbi:MAG: cell division protein ZapB [Candidatus Micrarchaeota archaeon]|nr:cell division protein ZapB [Candidatus Micrarchaeota archaeon]